MSDTSNWVKQHNLKLLSLAIGRYFTAYLEFTFEESEQAKVSEFCGRCQGEYSLLIPTEEVKEGFRQGIKEAMRGSPANISPSFKHFWFHARCLNCGGDLVLMRS